MAQHGSGWRQAKWAEQGWIDDGCRCAGIDKKLPGCGLGYFGSSFFQGLLTGLAGRDSDINDRSRRRVRETYARHEVFKSREK